MGSLSEQIQLVDETQRSLKVMADYDCFPLWETDQSGLRNLNPKDLPISRELACSLMAWAIEYDQCFDNTDPKMSGFPTRRLHEEFVRKGWVLAASLQTELGSGWTILYFNDLEGDIRQVFQNLP